MTVINKCNDLQIIRVFNAPVEVVWDAWTDDKQVAQWWGPRGFTITTHSKDLRPGGHWNYTMHGPDGADYENSTKYLEVEKYAKLVYDHGATADGEPLFRVTVLFSDSNGKTLMNMTMTSPNPEAAERTRMVVKKFGGNTTWDRLAEYINKESEGKETFVINRTFDAPLEVMFEMWTKPEHVAQWSAPAGSELEFHRADIRPGGSSFYSMTMGSPDKKMYGRTEYLEIQKPDRIVYIQQFCDENEKITRHPMAPTWPETMLTTVKLSAEGPDQTRVTLTWECYGAATREELETFLKGRGGMSQGWTGSFDKLEDYLEKHR